MKHSELEIFVEKIIKEMLKRPRKVVRESTKERIGRVLKRLHVNNKQKIFDVL